MSKLKEANKLLKKILAEKTNNEFIEELHTCQKQSHGVSLDAFLNELSENKWQKSQRYQAMETSLGKEAPNQAELQSLHTSTLKTVDVRVVSKLCKASSNFSASDTYNDFNRAA